MNNCTQNSTELLVSSIISTILTNVNTSIRFFQASPTMGMRLSLEESIAENLAFAGLVANESIEGSYVLEKLKQMKSDVIDGIKISILELPKNNKAAQ